MDYMDSFKFKFNYLLGDSNFQVTYSDLKYIVTGFFSDI